MGTTSTTKDRPVTHPKHFRLPPHTYMAGCNHINHVLVKQYVAEVNTCISFITGRRNGIKERDRGIAAMQQGDRCNVAMSAQSPGPNTSCHVDLKIKKKLPCSSAFSLR